MRLTQFKVATLRPGCGNSKVLLDSVGVVVVLLAPLLFKLNANVLVCVCVCGVRIQCQGVCRKRFKVTLSIAATSAHFS